MEAAPSISLPHVKAIEPILCIGRHIDNQILVYLATTISPMHGLRGHYVL